MSKANTDAQKQSAQLKAMGQRFIAAWNRAAKAGSPKRKYSAADLVAMQGKAPIVLEAQWDKMAAKGSETPL
jgi:hypothetical protein